MFEFETGWVFGRYFYDMAVASDYAFFQNYGCRITGLYLQQSGWNI